MKDDLQVRAKVSKYVGAKVFIKGPKGNFPDYPLYNLHSVASDVV